MKKSDFKIVYESEDDILNIWLSKKLYDYGEYEDGIVTHYTKGGEPVYIEVLFASRFLKKRANLKSRNISKEDIKEHSPVTIPHRIKLKLT